MQGTPPSGEGLKLAIKAAKLNKSRDSGFRKLQKLQLMSVNESPLKEKKDHNILNEGIIKVANYRLKEISTV